MLLRHLLNKCLRLLKLMNNSLAGGWNIGLDLILGLRIDKVDSVFVEVLELFVDQLDLSVGEGVTASVNESFDCCEHVYVDHVYFSLEVD